MSVAITRTKVIVPNLRPDLMSRTRLHRLLDDLLDFPLTLISAPAGYGKTSLMIDQAHNAPYPICWYTIDSLDKDPKRFLAHLVQSLKICFPEFGKITTNFINSRANPLDEPSGFVSTLVNELYQFTSEHFVIFLDDYHNLENAPEINAFTSRFIQEMDDNVHLVIASRRLIHFPDLPLMIGRRMVKAIGFDDLAFRSEEIKDYFRQVLGRTITSQVSQALEEKTEGWITGLLLSADQETIGNINKSKVEQVTGLDLFAYLAEQVFEHQPPVIQGFLLRSSIFDEFNLALCSQVLGDSEDNDWGGIISKLVQYNLFIQQVEDKGAWYRYHHLFRDFLRDRMHKELPDEEYKLLTRQMALFLDQGEWENAYRVSERLNHPDARAEVIIAASGDLIKSGRIHLLASWIYQLPPKNLNRNPITLILKGISSSMMGDPNTGLAILNQYIEDKNIRKDSSQLSRALLCRATTNRLLGNYQEAIEDIRTIYDQFKSSDITSISAETKREYGLAHFNIGNANKALDLFKKAIAEYEKLEDIDNKALAFQDIALVHMEIGNFNKAKKYTHLALNAWKLTDNHSNLSTLYNNLGALYFFKGKYKKSNKALILANDYACQFSNNRIKGYILASFGDLAMGLTLFNKAITKYRDALSLAETTQDYYLSTYLYVHLSTANRYLYNFQEASDHIETAKVFVIQKKSPNELAMLDLECGFLLLSMGDIEKAQMHFCKSLSHYDANNKNIESLKSNLGLMLTSWKKRNISDVDYYLNRIEDTLTLVDNFNPLIAELAHHKDTLYVIFDQINPGPNLTDLIKNIDRSIVHYREIQEELFPEINIKENAITRHLQVNAFFNEIVFLNGTEISAPEWNHQRTAREIFFFLISHPRGVSKEQVGLIFWPDSSPSQLTCQFKNAIYRLRRALGKDVILYDKTRRKYFFNRSIDYSYDVEEFTKLVQLAKQETDPELKAAAYQKAVEIYRHPFAPNLDGVWTEPIRRKLLNSYNMAILSVSKNAYEKQQYHSCIDYCIKVLEIEPCHEDACLLVMRCYSKLEKRVQMIEFYREIKNQLSNNFGLLPSSELRSLYEKIIK